MYQERKLIADSSVQKRSHCFSGVHKATLSAIAMRVHNQIVCPLESLTEKHPKLRGPIATPSRELMKPRKDNHDIENEAGHSEHDKSLVTRFASRQRP